MEKLQNQLELLPAEIKDAVALSKLINSAYRGEESTKGWTTEAHLLSGPRTDEDQVKELIQKSGATIIKCVQDNMILGCVYLEKQGSKIYLGMLSVSPGQQATGIGKKLLHAAEAHTKSLGCFAITMNVISVRIELIEWYERHGYIKTGTSKPFPAEEKYGNLAQKLILIDLEKELTSNNSV